MFKQTKKSVHEVCVCVCAAPPQSAAVLAWAKRISGGVFKKLLPPLISTHLSSVAPRHRCDAAFCAETWATVSRFRCRDTPALWRHFRGGGDAEETPACAGTSRPVPTPLLCNRETPFFDVFFCVVFFPRAMVFSLPVSSRRQVARSSLQPRLWDYVTEVWAVCPARAQKKTTTHNLL